MKKTVSLLLVTVLILSLSVTAFAGVTVEDIVNTKEISYIVPEDYEYCLFSEEEYLQYSHDELEGEIYIFCEENTDLPQGVKDLDESDALEVLKATFFLQGLYDDTYDIDVNSASLVNINGVSAYEINLCYSDSTGLLSSSGALCYILATKENTFVVAFDDIDDKFDNFETSKDFVTRLGVYGTYFDGEKTTINQPEGELPTFSEHVKKTNEIMDSWVDNAIEYNVGAGEDILGEDILGEDVMGAAAIGFVILGLGALVQLGLIVAVVVLAIKNSQKSKRIKDYEARLAGCPNVGYNYNPAPISTYPQQAYGQQPVQAYPQQQSQPEQKQGSILNGEPKDN